MLDPDTWTAPSFIHARMLRDHLCREECGSIVGTSRIHVLAAQPGVGKRAPELARLPAPRAWGLVIDFDCYLTCAVTRKKVAGIEVASWVGLLF